MCFRARVCSTQRSRSASNSAMPITVVENSPLTGWAEQTRDHRVEACANSNHQRQMNIRNAEVRREKVGRDIPAQFCYQ